METQTWRQRHLSTVTAELEDLVVNLQQPGSCCQACGGYQSLDQITVDVIEEMKSMLAVVRLWQSTQWAGEGRT